MMLILKALNGYDDSAATKATYKAQQPKSIGVGAAPAGQAMA